MSDDDKALADEARQKAMAKLIAQELVRQFTEWAGASVLRLVVVVALVALLALALKFGVIKVAAL